MTCEIQMEGGSEEQNGRDGGQLVTVIAMFWCSGARVHSSKDIQKKPRSSQNVTSDEALTDPPPDSKQLPQQV